MRGDGFWWVIALILLVTAVSGTWTLNEANKCAAKGGAYITGQGTFPACVQGVK